VSKSAFLCRISRESVAVKQLRCDRLVSRTSNRVFLRDVSGASKKKQFKEELANEKFHEGSHFHLRRNDCYGSSVSSTGADTERGK
jgi:hypothetical protein